MVLSHSRYVVVGAGIHGLSTAWHLARELRARGLGGGEDILVLDKRGIGAGASGIACGVVRNNYFQPGNAIVHYKVMVVEPLGDDGLVVRGSHQIGNKGS